MANTQVSRRSILAGSALLAAGTPALLAGCSGDDPAEGTPPPDGERGGESPAPEFDPGDWDAVRAQFALDPELAHFAAYVLASHPAPVRAAIERWREALDADPAAAVAGEIARDEEVRAAAAGHLGVDPAEVALTDSTTMGLGLVYHGCRFEVRLPTT